MCRSCLPIPIMSSLSAVLIPCSAKPLRRYRQMRQMPTPPAGMSANQYMELTTSFSASLIKSLGNDTDKAASYANSAIVDMSDNANKMGHRP